MSHDDQAPKPASEVPRSVLLIEDDLLISLDTEMSLIELGVAVVRTAHSVAKALVLIEAEPPDFALVDINLGEETSLEIVKSLAQRGIPFAVTSGYGEQVALSDEIRNAPKIPKPYTVDELKALLTSSSARPSAPG